MITITIRVTSIDVILWDTQTHTITYDTQTDNTLTFIVYLKLMLY
jgi:hypothetical protein